MLKFIEILEFIKRFLIDLVFPPTCPICHEIVENDNLLCENCSRNILRIVGKGFLRLNYKMESPFPIMKIFCVANYRDGARRYLLPLKFQNNLSVVSILKEVLSKVSYDHNLKEFLSQVDIATFVPLHKSRLEERGFNQNELIFHDFLVAQNIPIKNLLVRIKNTQKLFDLNPNERKEIMHDAFKAIENIDITGKNILIADDIYTTGATTSECAQVLKKHGANKIFVLAYSSDGD